MSPIVTAIVVEGQRYSLRDKLTLQTVVDTIYQTGSLDVELDYTGRPVRRLYFRGDTAKSYILETEIANVE